MSDNLNFMPVATEVGRRTLIWDVVSNGHNLGRVSWFAQWRRYCYFPVLAIHDGLVLDAECLTELATFCANETTARKQERAQEVDQALGLG